NGALSAVGVHNTTIAQVAPGAQITVGSGDVIDPATDSSRAKDYHASTVVQANDSTMLANGAGGILAAKNAGLAGSVPVDFLDRAPEALIGDPSTAPAQVPPVRDFLVNLVQEFDHARGVFCGNELFGNLLQAFDLVGDGGSTSGAHSIHSAGPVLVSA